MAKVSEEEYEQLEADRRHRELLATLRNIRPEGEVLAPMLTAIAKQIGDIKLPDEKETDMSGVTKALTMLAQEVNAIKAVVSKPKTFRVIRGNGGFIEKVEQE